MITYAYPCQDIQGIIHAHTSARRSTLSHGVAAPSSMNADLGLTPAFLDLFGISNDVRNELDVLHQLWLNNRVSSEVDLLPQLTGQDDHEALILRNLVKLRVFRAIHRLEVIINAPTPIYDQATSDVAGCTDGHINLFRLLGKGDWRLYALWAIAHREVPSATPLDCINYILNIWIREAAML